MDHSWRPPPILPGNNTNICPICSISHFPFCPPPPVIQNPRFHHPQPQNNYYHQRPPFDHHHQRPPFDHHHPFPNHHTSINNNYHCNFGDGRRPTWYGTGSNPTLDPSPYGGTGDHNINHHPRGGFASASYGYDGYDNGGIKRMKIEPVDNNRGPRGPLMGGEIGASSDNERILKLIHDHGNVAVNGDTGFKGHYAPNSFERKEPYSYGKNNVHYDPKGQYVPNNFGTNLGQLEVHHSYSGQPPLPASPPPPLPVDIPPKKPSLFPVAVSSSSGSAVLDNQSGGAPVYYSNNASSLSSAEEFHIRQSSSEKHVRDAQPFTLRRLSSERQNIIDASHIFKQPHRASRPDHFVIILRGLPGSGKSYLAKVLRDIEVENGGKAPRIHSMDEYFMIEVEKAEDSELSKSLRGKRQVMKTVMEYCYEPEMEEAYRASMLKAFKKTLDEGVYSFIIVDDRNLRVADFAQFWATAKRSGYEVYLVEAAYKDPAGCAARNVHNFTLPDIQKMAGQWEEAPSIYLKMDIKSLLHGDGSIETDIQEVDMDMEDEDADVKKPHGETKDEVDDFRPHDQVNDLSRSKWSNDFDTEEAKGGINKNSGGALLGLAEAYSSNKEAKSISWGDQGGNVGFSISATRKSTTRSLVIGPGPGYNLKSNPLSEEEYRKPARNAVEPTSQSVFQEQIRAERESFKAVFDKRRQRIGGFNIDDE